MRDEGGAIMIIGVFMAILLVGLLYYMAGIGNTMFHSQRMQDTADAVALSTAVGHARGMNLIAFINLVMAGLVAIVLALKIIELMLTGLTLILVGISWFFPPAAAAIPVVNTARDVTRTVHDAARNIVDAILVGLSAAETAIKTITPAQSVIVGMVKVGGRHSHLVDLAAGIPTRATLPVEKDRYNELCDRAGNIIEGLIVDATRNIPLVNKVLGMVAGGLMDAVKYAFCYKDGTPPPEASVDIERNLPIHPTPGLACETDKSNMVVDSDNCRRWEDELRRRHPDGQGNCATSDEDLCKRTLADARDQCHPRNGAKESYSWTEERVREHLVFDTELWEWRTESFEYDGSPRPRNVQTYEDAIGDFENAQLAAQGGNPPPEYFEQLEAQAPAKVRGTPCRNYSVGWQGNNADDWSDWNTQTEWQEQGEDIDPTRPVCTKRRQALLAKNVPGALVSGFENPPRPPGSPGDPMPPDIDPAGYFLEYDTVKNVFECSEKAKIPLKMPETWASETGGPGGQDKAPMKMEDDVALGSNTFQVRGAVVSFTDRRPARPDRKLRVSAFGRTPGEDFWVGVARKSGQAAVAQAEYYFNHNGVKNREPKEWLWNMDWRARLMRFRLPDDDAPGAEWDANSLASFGEEGLPITLDDIEFPGGGDGGMDLETLNALVNH